MEGSKKYIIGGNWKSNGTVQSIKDLVKNILNTAQFNPDKLEIVVAPISIHIASVKAMINSKISVAAQNMSESGNGAFTGEISGEQLLDFDLQWVILGHSERRTLYNETNESVAKKLAKAQNLGLNTIVCIGESLEQREDGTTNDHLKCQLDAIKDSV